MKQRWTAAVGALLGLAWYLWHGGGVSIAPTHIDWLLQTDWIQHYVGWAFFREEPLGLPLGKLTRLGAPIGTSVAMTDANPLMSMVFRPFSTLLPAEFQFIGLAMALNFALQGWVGARLARAVGAKPAAQMLGAALFVLTPPLMERISHGHDGLTAQWTVLAALLLLVGDVAEWTPRGLSSALVTLCAVAIATHSYVIAIVFPLLCCALLRLSRYEPRIPRQQALLTLAGMLLAVFGLASMLGFLGGDEIPWRGGFGVYTADLTTLFNPMAWSRLLPTLPTHVGADEGFAYLGAGGILLVVSGLALGAWKRPEGLHRGWWLLGVVTVGATWMAFSDWVAYKGTVILDLRAITEPLLPLFSVLRASGRFIWVLHYGLLLLGFTCVVRALDASKSTLLLGACVALQLVDLNPQRIDSAFNQPPAFPLRSHVWQHVTDPYEHLVLYPPVFTDSGVHCGTQEFPPRFELPFGVLAARGNVSINSAFASRCDHRAIEGYCAALTTQINARNFEKDTVYIVHDAALPQFAEVSSMECGRFDDINVCVHRETDSLLLASIVKGKQNL